MAHSVLAITDVLNEDIFHVLTLFLPESSALFQATVHGSLKTDINSIMIKDRWQARFLCRTFQSIINSTTKLKLCIDDPPITSSGRYHVTRTTNSKRAYGQTGFKIFEPTDLIGSFLVDCISHVQLRLSYSSHIRSTVLMPDIFDELTKVITRPCQVSLDLTIEEAASSSALDLKALLLTSFGSRYQNLFLVDLNLPLLTLHSGFTALSQKHVDCLANILWFCAYENAKLRSICDLNINVLQQCLVLCFKKTGSEIGFKTRFGTAFSSVTSLHIMAGRFNSLECSCGSSDVQCLHLEHYFPHLNSLRISDIQSPINLESLSQLPELDKLVLEFQASSTWASSNHLNHKQSNSCFKANCNTLRTLEIYGTSLSSYRNLEASLRNVFSWASDRLEHLSVDVFTKSMCEATTTLAKQGQFRSLKSMSILVNKTPEKFQRELKQFFAELSMYNNASQFESLNVQMNGESCTYTSNNSNSAMTTFNFFHGDGDLSLITCLPKTLKELQLHNIVTPPTGLADTHFAEDWQAWTTKLVEHLLCCSYLSNLRLTCALQCTLQRLIDICLFYNCLRLSNWSGSVRNSVAQLNGNSRSVGVKLELLKHNGNKATLELQLKVAALLNAN